MDKQDIEVIASSITDSIGQGFEDIKYVISQNSNKGKLEFNLNDSDQELKFKRAVAANDIFDAIYEYDQELRRKLKYDDKLKPGVYDGLEQARELLFEYLNDKGINLDRMTE